MDPYTEKDFLPFIPNHVACFVPRGKLELDGFDVLVDHGKYSDLNLLQYVSNWSKEQGAKKKLR